MSTIQVKPHPDLNLAAHKLLKHPASGGLLDAAGRIPADGRPWLNDGFTARMLTDSAIIRADHPAFTDMGKEPQPQKTSDVKSEQKPADPPRLPLQSTTPPKSGSDKAS